MTAATIPFAVSPGDHQSDAAARSAAEPRAAARAAGGREWTPSQRDQLVFRWVKFEGKAQGWVAEQLGLHQSTVSRMVEKYERWIARGGPGRQGGLTHDERVRAQRWLTYERNEWIIATAMRMAAELELPMDTTKSTISHPAAKPSQESEIRTQHLTIDSRGSVARYLRIVHRVSMDNLKLVELEPLPDLEPLTIEDVGEDGLPALAEEMVAEEMVAEESVVGGDYHTDAVASDTSAHPASNAGEAMVE